MSAFPDSRGVSGKIRRIVEKCVSRELQNSRFIVKKHRVGKKNIQALEGIVFS